MNQRVKARRASRALLATLCVLMVLIGLWAIQSGRHGRSSQNSQIAPAEAFQAMEQLPWAEVGSRVEFVDEITSATIESASESALLTKQQEQRLRLAAASFLHDRVSAIEARDYAKSALLDGKPRRSLGALFSGQAPSKDEAAPEPESEWWERFTESWNKMQSTPASRVLGLCTAPSCFRLNIGHVGAKYPSFPQSADSQEVQWTGARADLGVSWFRRQTPAELMRSDPPALVARLSVVAVFGDNARRPLTALFVWNDTQAAWELAGVSIFGKSDDPVRTFHF